MDTKEYVIYTPYVTVDGERVEANIASDSFKLEEIGETHEELAASIIDEVLNDGKNLTVDVGYLVTPDSLQNNDELEVNRDYACVMIREDGLFDSSLLVNISAFLAKLRENGIELIYRNRVMYSRSITMLVEDGGFKAAPELRASRILDYVPFEGKKHI